MKKNGNSSIKFVDNLFNRIKNSLKNPSKKAFGKIGLFLILGVMIWSSSFINNSFKFSTIVEAQTSTSSNSWYDKLLKEMDDSIKAMGTPGGLAREADSQMKLLTDTRNGAVKGGLLWVFNWLLYSVLWAISKLLIIAAMLLDFALKTDYLRDLIKEGTVYKLWAAVRDILNLFFMMLLLFAAFCTIFQVEKYNLKKIIIMLVVMALLVNFSYVIAVFVVDFSNSAMSFIIEVAFPNNSSASSSAYIGKVLGFGETLKDQFDGSKVSYISGDTTGQIIVAIILLFIYTVTIMALAINLLIRMIAFIVLVILSPFGFVFAFFPGTSSISNDWWDKLLKYAFMGPVLAFFLLITMVLFSKGTLNSSTNVTGTAIPIHIIGVIFLWMGLTISQKMGGMGSEMAMGMAKKVGNNIKSYGQKAAWGATKAIGRFADDRTGNIASGGVGAVKMKLAQWNNDHKSKSESRAAQFGSAIGVSGAKEKDMRRRAEEYKKNHAQPDELKNLAIKGDAAAAYRLAEDKDMDQNTYDKFMGINTDDSLRKAINSKTKQTRIDLVAINNAKSKAGKMTATDIANKKAEIVLKNPAAATWSGNAIKNYVEQEEINNEIGKLSSEKWADQDWSEMAKGLSLADRGRIAVATKKAYGKFKSPAVAELQKRINPNNAGALNSKFGVPV